jgi:site-specific DNA recombinase
MKNIGYIRVSTDYQDNSVITQKEMIESYSKIHGLEIDDFFIDFGISGKNTIKREKYLELMELVENGKVKTIITTSLSRWSRNTLDLLNSIEVLKTNNTDLMVIKENIPSLKTSMGEFFISILGSVYTLERNLTSERTKDVIQNKKMNGKVYSRTPYGFDTEDGNLIENPYEQKVLRKIRKMRMDGKSFNNISIFLNRNNHKTKMGKDFTKGIVFNLLKIDREIINSSSTNIGING